MTAYNYGHFLADCLESALSQTRPPAEIIVVDDGSTDATPAVLARYSDRVQAVRQANRGQGHAFNAGFARSTGDLVLFLDADDTLRPHALESVASAWTSNLSVLSFGLELIDARGRSVGLYEDTFHAPEGDRLPALLRAGGFAFAPTSGNVFSRAVLDALMPMAADRWRISPDAVLIRAAAIHGPAAVLPQVLGGYRTHGANAYWRDGASRAWLDDRALADIGDAVASVAEAPDALFAARPDPPAIRRHLWLTALDHARRVAERTGNRDGLDRLLRRAARHGHGLNWRDRLLVRAAGRSARVSRWLRHPITRPPVLSALLDTCGHTVFEQRLVDAAAARPADTPLAVGQQMIEWSPHLFGQGFDARGDGAPIWTALGTKARLTLRLADRAKPTRAILHLVPEGVAPTISLSHTARGEDGRLGHIVGHGPQDLEVVIPADAADADGIVQLELTSVMTRRASGGDPVGPDGAGRFVRSASATHMVHTLASATARPWMAIPRVRLAALRVEPMAPVAQAPFLAWGASASLVDLVVADPHAFGWMDASDAPLGEPPAWPSWGMERLMPTGVNAAAGDGVPGAHVSGEAGLGIRTIGPVSEAELTLTVLAGHGALAVRINGEPAFTGDVDGPNELVLRCRPGARAHLAAASDLASDELARPWDDKPAVDLLDVTLDVAFLPALDAADGHRRLALGDLRVDRVDIRDPAPPLSPGQRLSPAAPASSWSSDASDRSALDIASELEPADAAPVEERVHRSPPAEPPAWLPPEAWTFDADGHAVTLSEMAPIWLRPTRGSEDAARIVLTVTPLVPPPKGLRHVVGAFHAGRPLAAGELVGPGEIAVELPVGRSVEVMLQSQLVDPKGESFAGPAAIRLESVRRELDGLRGRVTSVAARAFRDPIPGALSSLMSDPDGADRARAREWLSALDAGGLRALTAQSGALAAIEKAGRSHRGAPSRSAEPSGEITEHTRATALLAAMLDTHPIALRETVAPWDPPIALLQDPGPYARFMAASPPGSPRAPTVLARALEMARERGVRPCAPPLWRAYARALTEAVDPLVWAGRPGSIDVLRAWGRLIEALLLHDGQDVHRRPPPRRRDAPLAVGILTGDLTAASADAADDHHHLLCLVAPAASVKNEAFDLGSIHDLSALGLAAAVDRIRALNLDRLMVRDLPRRIAPENAPIDAVVYRLLAHCLARDMVLAPHLAGLAEAFPRLGPTT